ATVTTQRMSPLRMIRRARRRTILPTTTRARTGRTRSPPTPDPRRPDGASRATSRTLFTILVWESTDDSTLGPHPSWWARSDRAARHRWKSAFHCRAYRAGLGAGGGRGETGLDPGLRLRAAGQLCGA